MITTKALALSMLLVSSLTLARVQLHTQAQHQNSERYGNRSIDITFQIDKHQPLEIYNHDKIKIVAELLAEEEARATVSFTFYGKNNADEYEILLAPVIVPNYIDPAKVSLSSSDGELFTMTVQAQKV
ncbi:MAG: hypothetical protein WCE21_00155 [Candidatus Babeliales bacterium]